MTIREHLARGPFAYALVVALALFAIAACGGGADQAGPAAGSPGAETAPATESDLSAMARAGEGLFNANCSVCHGVGATGTNQGPPLIDRTYHPGHHPDFSFRNAVQNGVRSHHWDFGDMPPVPGISADDVEKIICYVRETQRAEGLFDGNALSTVC